MQNAARRAPAAQDSLAKKLMKVKEIMKKANKPTLESRKDVKEPKNAEGRRSESFRFPRDRAKWKQQVKGAESPGNQRIDRY